MRGLEKGDCVRHRRHSSSEKENPEKGFEQCPLRMILRFSGESRRIRLRIEMEPMFVEFPSITQPCKVSIFYVLLSLLSQLSNPGNQGYPDLVENYKAETASPTQARVFALSRMRASSLSFSGV